MDDEAGGQHVGYLAGRAIRQEMTVEGPDPIRHTDEASAAPVRLAVGDTAPESPITLADGQVARLSELWRDGPIVLAFLRHLG